jgi:hypothetical protein
MELGHLVRRRVYVAMQAFVTTLAAGSVNIPVMLRLLLLLLLLVVPGCT